MMPMAAALNLLLINLSQRFDVNRLEQLPLRQLLSKRRLSTVWSRIQDPVT